MVDRDIVFAKMGSAKHHITRVKRHAEIKRSEFQVNEDTQDVVVFNFQLAIQNCIDIAAHIVSGEGMGLAGSTNEMFYFLEEHQIIDQQLAEKMTKAVGLRNLIVHEYGKLDMAKIYQASQNDINDLHDFLKAVVIAYDL